MFFRCDEFPEKAIVIKHNLITLIKSKQTFLPHLSTSASYYRTASKAIISFALHTHTELLRLQVSVFITAGGAWAELFNGRKFPEVFVTDDLHAEHLALEHSAWHCESWSTIADDVLTSSNWSVPTHQQQQPLYTHHSTRTCTLWRCKSTPTRSKRSRGPSSMLLPNLKHIAVFVPKLLRGPKISKFGHVT